ncbi:twin-arginine translocase TatA/TatE family subunit [Brachybacterium avium]|uniref:Sec-independent protein translocase protein TatA n=1 Tax=Brachybacterium avium TaxID=2017485 RepID=A0A220U919_9MICO|nr:Sec-independent protein translocase subunit TatA [Brachybacterium avium]ASK64580.1 twin-arginine translocase TatA/TatE family subunit [Brachybacterium avium]
MNFFRNPWAIVLLIVLVILLFGANKLPGLARNMGKSMRIFKSEVEELRGEDKASDEDDEHDRPARSSRPREDRRDRDERDVRRDDRHDRDDRDDREYDPRDDSDREPIRARDDDDSYRRD